MAIVSARGGDNSDGALHLFASRFDLFEENYEEFEQESAYVDPMHEWRVPGPHRRSAGEVHRVVFRHYKERRLTALSLRT